MVLTPTQIRATLAELGARPEKAFGQNFLIDQVILNTVVEAAELTSDDMVLEIGPGLGVLTEDLLATGAHISAIERDHKFIEHLQARFSDKADRFSLTQGDAAELEWNNVISSKKSWKLVSNLPYAISSFALRTALYGTQPVSRIVVMLQREVAERAVALLRGEQKNGDTSLLSLMVALRCKSGSIVRRVPAGCFFPAPKVESAILLLEPFSPQEDVKQWGIDPESIMTLAKRGFAHPRKQLFSTLGLRERAEELAAAICAPKEVRPEALSTSQWAALTRLLTPSIERPVAHGDK